MRGSSVLGHREGARAEGEEVHQLQSVAAALHQLALLVRVGIRVRVRVRVRVRAERHTSTTGRARDRELQGDTGRYGEPWGDMGRYLDHGARERGVRV